MHCPIGNQIRGPLGKESVCSNFALTVIKFMFSHSGNFRAKANPPKPRSCPKCPFRQWLGPISSADWTMRIHCYSKKGRACPRQYWCPSKKWCPTTSYGPAFQSSPTFYVNLQTAANRLMVTCTKLVLSLTILVPVASWTSLHHLHLSYVSLIGFSNDILAHFSNSSIHCIFGLPWSPLVSCSWNNALHDLLLYADNHLFSSHDRLIKLNRSRSTPATSNTHSFIFSCVHDTLKIFLMQFISNASIPSSE